VPATPTWVTAGVSAEVSVRGQRVAFIRAGHGPALVLLHGIGSNAKSWSPLQPLLSDYTTMAWDMPGYGGSAPFAVDRPSPAHYADALKGMLDACAVEKATIVGHSLGAVVAAEFARIHADRVAALILSAPALGSGVSPGGALPENVAVRLRDLETLGPAEFARIRAPNLCAPESSPAAKKAVEEAMASVSLPGYAQACGLLAEANLLEALPTLSLSGLVIGGGKDRVVPPEKARAAARAWKGARYAEIPHVGHAPYVEDPAAYAALLLSHLRETSR
jgi:pimeloyl-ACP methyl ester carboxylesterase